LTPSRWRRPRPVFDAVDGTRSPVASESPCSRWAGNPDGHARRDRDRRVPDRGCGSRFPRSRPRSAIPGRDDRLDLCVARGCRRSRRNRADAAGADHLQPGGRWPAWPAAPRTAKSRFPVDPTGARAAFSSTPRMQLGSRGLGCRVPAARIRRPVALELPSWVTSAGLSRTARGSR
jgi:hypothetical protein